MMIVSHLDDPQTMQRKDLDLIEKMDISIDLGTYTLKAWAKEWEKAKTILWNGPVGKIETKEYGFGTRLMAKILGRISKKQGVFVVAGGGDTLPSIVESGAMNALDHVSCGGGAMLEFIALKGKLPGLLPLIK
jgi:phosphoglycerate kinase